MRRVVGQVDPVLDEPGRRIPFPDAADDAESTVGRGTWEDQQELLAAHAAKHVLIPHPFAADAGEMAEYGVARIVPVRSVAVLASFRLSPGASLPDGVNLYEFDAGMSAARFRYTLIGAGSSWPIRPAAGWSGSLE